VYYLLHTTRNTIASCCLDCFATTTDYWRSKQQLRTDAATTRLPDQSGKDRARISPRLGQPSPVI